MRRQRGEPNTYATPGRLLELSSDIDDDVAPETIFNDLVKRYNEPHRRYHNLRHVSRCLQELDEAPSLADHPMEVELALWFHDTVYDPRRSDNEEASAVYAREALSRLLQGEQIELIHNLIMATKHTEPPSTNDGRLIADIDLSILGRPGEEYREYEDGVRREYGWVPEDRFRDGRVEVLARFLARDHIYYTDHFRERYEDKARANLSHSISKFRASDHSHLTVFDVDQSRHVHGITFMLGQ